MTGSDYINLCLGDKCVLLRDINAGFSKWNKGDIIEVVYKNRFEDSIIFKNDSVKYCNNPTYEVFSVSACFKNLEIFTEEKVKQDSLITTEFTHKFSVGDTIWQMEYNRPVSHEILKLHYTDDGDTQSFDYICTNNLILDDNCTIFGSKDELLDSLR